MLGAYQNMLGQVKRQTRVRGYVITKIVNKNWGDTRKFLAVNPHTGKSHVFYCLCSVSKRRLISTMEYDRIMNEPTDSENGVQ